MRAEYYKIEIYIPKKFGSHHPKAPQTRHKLHKLSLLSYTLLVSLVTHISIITIQLYNASATQ